MLEKQVGKEDLAAMLATKKLADVASDGNLINPLHQGKKVGGGSSLALKLKADIIRIPK